MIFVVNTKPRQFYVEADCYNSAAIKAAKEILPEKYHEKLTTQRHTGQHDGPGWFVPVVEGEFFYWSMHIEVLSINNPRHEVSMQV